MLSTSAGIDADDTTQDVSRYVEVKRLCTYEQSEDSCCESDFACTDDESGRRTAIAELPNEQNQLDNVNLFVLTSEHTNAHRISNICSRENTDRNNSPLRAEIENSSSLSDDTSYAESQAGAHIGRNCVEFQAWLEAWVTTHRIPHVAVSQLLRKLNSTFDTDLPIDARTLLGTPRFTSTRSVPPGEYAHFSLEKHLERVILNSNEAVQSTTLHLFFYIDGVRLGNSTADQFWPIIGRCEELSPQLMFVIGCYQGKGKPHSVDDFLSEFVEELSLLLQRGITVQGSHYDVSCKAFICDAPARAFLLGTKYHGGYYGCTKCKQKGHYCRGKVVFPETNAPLRSDLDFAEKSCPEHHVSNTPLSALPFGLVSGFPYEYMHLVCLGVQKKLIQLWKGERRSTFRLRHDQISELSTKLTSVGSYVCREFARRPQSLQDLGAWKATEYRQFLLYSGPALLQGYLDRKRYEHFLVLHVAITILAHPQLCSELNDYARRLLTFFVHTSIDIYGIENVTYNVHGLVHLADDVRLFGPLDAFSAFAAESFMGKLKALVRPGRLQLQQLHRRLYEARQAADDNASCPDTPQENQRLRSEHRGVCLPENCCGPQYCVARVNGTFLKADIANSCCLLKDGNVIVAESFAFDSENMPVVVGRSYARRKPLYNYPICSLFLDVQKVSVLSQNLRSWKLDDIKTKCFRVPTGHDEFAVFPLIHAAVM